MSTKSQHSISPIAAAVSAALATPAVALAQDDGSTATLDEIIVTARKREENVQRIPASVQAIPEAMLHDMGALNTEDYVRFMPSVNWINFNTAGSNAIIFRGVNTTSSGFTGRQSSSVYLDEIPLTSTAGDQPNIRMMDVRRVEALAGPQGTLFGAAAQAGTLRILSNKPDPSRFEASAEVMFRTGEESDPSHAITGVLNLPLVEDVFAIRIAAQSAEDGGFIDNVLGHMPDAWFGTGYGPTDTRSEWGSYRNDDVAEENWNSVDYIALRIGARWDINDNWAATATYHYGDTEAQGSNAYNPFVGDLETINFAKNYSRDEWDMVSLVIEADYDFAQFVSATSFFDRQRTYQIDNTLYYKYYQNNYCGDVGAAPAPAAYYWLWDNAATGRAVYLPLYCPSPVSGSPSGDVSKLPDMPGIGNGPEWQERFSQEFRLSHVGETFDWLAGLYYEDTNDSWNSVWMRSSITPYQDSLSYAYIIDQVAPGNADAAAAVAAGDADHYWHSYDNTDWKQKAVFGEFTWHINDQWNATFGGRWFETENTKVYDKQLAGGTAANGRATPGYQQPRWAGNDITQTRTISEFVPKLSVAWNISDDKMAYGTYTVGFRTGGVNRANKNADWDRTLFAQEWSPDKLKNYEIGYKSRYAQNTVQLNLIGFYMDFEDLQHEVVDPSSNTCIAPAEAPSCNPTGELPWISIVGNVGDAHIAGVTVEADWVPAERWNIGANLQFIEAELDETLPNDSGLVAGLRLPNHPELQGAAWATYSWPVDFLPGGGEMFLRAQGSYTGETLTRLVPSPETSANPSFTNESYSIWDLRWGTVSGDGAWQLDLFINNITDERAQIQQGSSGAWQWSRTGEYDRWHTVYTVRPREYGFRVTARWGG